MLKKSLMIKTYPKAEKANIVHWGNYRITVLGDRLFRVEKSAKKLFRDKATQSVFFRNMPKQSFTFTDNGNSAAIETSACTLVLAKARRDCYIILNGEKKPLENAENLGGTYRTLDQYNGNRKIQDGKKIPLGKGICSRSGVALFDDASSLTLNENGEIEAQRGNGTDEYVFAFGNDYRAALKALYSITGYTPLVPRYALGNWWSRYHIYTDREYLTVLDNFKEKDIPLTVATIDMDWHHSTEVDKDLKITELGRDGDEFGGNSGWTGYTWNEKLFPDYRRFLGQIKDRDLKITLNLHPAQGIRWFESMYREMALEMGIDPDTYKPVEFDISDSKFINAYFDIVHKPYEREGVDFWWIDWQQGTKTKVEGLDPLWSLNHYHYHDNAENHFSPLILSRYAGIGSHRYPLGFSGDTAITWDTLRYLPEFTATASNIGYTWWSHDIGGHMMGENNFELFLRHAQYGVFSPINRLHCSCADTITKEPWAYENGTGGIIENWLKLRHSLIPFLYTKNYETHKDGKALVEPLYYEWQDSLAYKYKNEYLFGGLLVAPVTKKMNKDGYARVKMWIPEGEWTDIFTGDKYHAEKGGKEIIALRRLESIPVLAKAGTVIPYSKDKSNSVKNPEALKVEVYRGNGTFSLFEDGRENENTKECFTHFVSTLSDSVQTLKITFEGNKAVIPKNRVVRVVFKDIKNGSVTVKKNGSALDIEQLYLTDPSIEFPFDTSAEYEISINFTPKTEAEELIDRAMSVITKSEDVHDNKIKAFDAIKKATSKEEYIKAVEESPVTNTIKEKLKETL